MRRPASFTCPRQGPGWGGGMQLVAGLLGVEAGQDAVFRALFFQRRREQVPPYRGIMVAEFTDRVSALRKRLGRCGVKDEGLTVPPKLGADGAICTNMLSADRDSLSYSSGFHPNTHIMDVISGQMKYEVSDDPIYKEIAMFFMETLNSSHVCATGGTSCQ